MERIRKGVFITKRGLAKEFGVTQKTIQRDFDRLKGKIAFEGSKKKGRWIIVA
jgi:predicted DNA-binding transcriptional regulator YafY